jgi:hypothetical protein
LCEEIACPKNCDDPVDQNMGTIPPDHRKASLVLKLLYMFNSGKPVNCINDQCAAKHESDIGIQLNTPSSHIIGKRDKGSSTGRDPETAVQDQIGKFSDL